MGILSRNRFRKRVVGAASLLAFLLFTGMAPFVLAAEVWPTWPPKETAPPPAESPKGTISEEPVKEGAPAAPAPEAAAKAGEAAGKKASAGISRGTLGWAAAIIAAGVVIGVAAGGGGGGGSTSNH